MSEFKAEFHSLEGQQPVHPTVARVVNLSQGTYTFVQRRLQSGLSWGFALLPISAQAFVYRNQPAMLRLRDSPIWFYATLVLVGILLLSHTNTITTGGNVLNIRQRMARSENIWAENRKLRDVGFALFNGNASFFPTVNTETYFKYSVSVWDWAVASYNCPWDLQRVGRIGDGGKWVCGYSRFQELSQRPCVIYSFGVQYESTWEEAMLLNTNCNVYAYDPAVDKMGPQMSPEALKRVKFTQAAVGGETNTHAQPPIYTLKDLMHMNGHDYIDVLKMDIEYHEFATMTRFLQDFGGSLPIGQFLVEIHLFQNRDIDNTNTFMKWWESLEAGGLRAVMTEPNLIYVTLRLEDAMPRLAEYTFINVRDTRNILLLE